MYFKITDEDQSGFELKTGLNILNDDDESLVLEEFTGSHIPYPIPYFTDSEGIHHYYYTGCWIRQVIVPRDAKINCGFEKQWISDKIIVGDRFSLYDVKTIKKFNLKITDLYISEVCKRGKVNILEWWKNSGLELKYDMKALDFASSYGHVEVLEWWKNSGLELKYTGNALDFASRYGHVEVLEWWKNSGLKLNYDAKALNWASENGQIKVLEWWKNSGLELKYTIDASRNCRAQALEWWKNSGLIK
jgi:hypothetical protein